MDTNINNYKTAGEVAKQLSVQYPTLLSWIKKDLEKIKSKGLAIKKSSWLIHKSAIPIIKKAIKDGIVSSQ